VTYQIIDHFSIEQALLRILYIQDPANATNGNWVDVYNAFSHVAYGVRIRISGFIVHCDIFVSVEALVGMKTY
jgi:hypothetical protein